MGVLRIGSVSLACRLALVLAGGGVLVAAQHARGQGRSRPVTYYGDVLPVLEKRCLSCHVPGGIAASSFAEYSDVKPHAEAIRDAVQSGTMPPWFADASVGEFVNVPRLTPAEIETIDAWVASGAQPGKPGQRRGAPQTGFGEISSDLVLTAEQPLTIPANRESDYTYVVLSLPFTFDRWIRAAEIRPGNPRLVHHAVLYIRGPRSRWLRSLTPGVPYSPPNPLAAAEARNIDDEILAVYAPGADDMVCPDGMAKRVPAGSDLVLQVHYRTSPQPASDQPEVGLAVLEATPQKRVLTLPLSTPGPGGGAPSISGPFGVDALVLGVFPRSYLPGVGSTFDIVRPDRGVETILKVKANRIGLQLNYTLKAPQAFPKGSVLKWVPVSEPAGTPVPASSGESGDGESFAGYFDVAVDLNVGANNVLRR